MNAKRNISILVGGTMLLLIMVATGCVVPGNGHEDVGASYGVNYYEPFDNNGWWGPGYLVGPSRGDRIGHDDQRTHAWHADPGDRGTVPSLPRGRLGGVDDGHHGSDGSVGSH